MQRYGPGPAKYVLPPTIGCKPHDPRKYKGPCYSIGRRLNKNDDVVGPGPGTYTLGIHNRYGKEHFPSYMGDMLHDRITDQAPAPNAYNLPSSNVCARRQPAYGIANKLDNRYNNDVPAPNNYKLPDLIGSATRKSCSISTRNAPAYTMAKRLNTKDTSSTPGPQYLPKFVDYGKLATTMKFRQKNTIDSGIPGPGRYNLAHHRPGDKVPAWSMGIRYPDSWLPNIIDEDY